jgi:hypothetical protein
MDQLKQWIREQDLDGDMPETDADAYQELVQQTISDNVIEVKK